MLSNTILDNNLNDTVTYKEFFEALGYDANEKIYFRTFDDQDKKAHAHKEYETVSEFAKKKRVYLKLKAENGGTRSVHFVVNGGGDTMEAVKRSGCCKAQFMEIDNIPFNKQIEKLNSFAFEPSIIIKSKKSLHCYWILKDGDIDKFSHIQSQLIQYFDSDEGLTQENHCMRLFGFYHHKAEPTEVKLIKFDPLMVYTQSELSAELPEVKIEPKKKEKLKTANGTADGAKIPHGEHFYYIRSKVGYYVAKLPDASAKVILNALYTDYTENCEGYEDSIDDFETRFMPFIEKCQENAAEEKKDPDYYRKALKVWKEVTGKEFDDSVTSWGEIEQIYLQSLDDDQRIEEGYKSMKADQSSSQSSYNPEKVKEEKDAPEASDRIKNYKPISAYIEQFKHDRESSPHAIRTGIDAVDKLLHGGFVNEMYTMTAQTGSGKSALMSNFAENIACNSENDPVHVFYYALEMGVNEFLARGASRYSFEHTNNPIPFSEIINDVWQLNPVTMREEWLRTPYSKYERYVEGFAKKVRDKFTVIERGKDDITATTIYNDVIEYKKEHPDERIVVFVDYLQILSYDKDDRDENTLVSNASQKLKSLATQEGCTVFTVSSMPKDESRKNKEGVMLDENSARGSGQLGYNTGCMLSWEWGFWKDLSESDKKAYNELSATKKKENSQLYQKNALKNCNKKGYRTQNIGIIKFRNAPKGEDLCTYYYPAYNYITDKSPDAEEVKTYNFDDEIETNDYLTLTKSDIDSKKEAFKEVVEKYIQEENKQEDEYIFIDLNELVTKTLIRIDKIKIAEEATSAMINKFIKDFIQIYFVGELGQIKGTANSGRKYITSYSMINGFKEDNSENDAKKGSKPKSLEELAKEKNKK